MTADTLWNLLQTTTIDMLHPLIALVYFLVKHKKVV